MVAPATAVLVVDDEPLIRALAAEALEDAGFAVLEAPTGDYALAVLNREPGIRVLFTDVDMPGELDGFQLARVVQDHHHHVSVIITSGAAQPGPYDMAPDAKFISKPYSLQVMVDLVRALTSGGRPVAGACHFAR